MMSVGNFARKFINAHLFLCLGFIVSCFFVTPLRAGDETGESLVILHEQGLPGQTRPHSGYIDPLQDVDSSLEPNGLTLCTLRFNRDVFSCDDELNDVDVFDFEITETGSGNPPVIESVEYVDDDRTLVRVNWDRPITLQEWTTVRAIVCDANGEAIQNLGDLGEEYEPDRVDFAFLPVDVDQSGKADPFDLFEFRRSVVTGDIPELGMRVDYLDNDRTGSITPLCLFRIRQLINGVNTTKAWGAQELYHDRP